MPTDPVRCRVSEDGRQRHRLIPLPRCAAVIAALACPAAHPPPPTRCRPLTASATCPAFALAVSACLSASDGLCRPAERRLRVIPPLLQRGVAAPVTPLRRPRDRSARAPADSPPQRSQREPAGALHQALLSFRAAAAAQGAEEAAKASQPSTHGLGLVAGMRAEEVCSSVAALQPAPPLEHAAMLLSIWRGGCGSGGGAK